MARILPPEEKVTGGNPFEIGAVTADSVALKNNATKNQAGDKFRPSSEQMYEAEYRLNTVHGAYVNKDKTPEQKKLEEEEARKMLSYGTFGQNVWASVRQTENIGLALTEIGVTMGIGAALGGPVGAAGGAAVGTVKTAGRVIASTVGKTFGRRIATNAAVAAAVTTGTEIAISDMQETRTGLESAMNVGSAAVIGAGFQAVGEPAGRAIGKAWKNTFGKADAVEPAPVVVNPTVANDTNLGAAVIKNFVDTTTNSNAMRSVRGRENVGPAEQAYRQSRLNQGSSVEADVGRAIREGGSTAPVRHESTSLNARQRDWLHEQANMKSVDEFIYNATATPHMEEAVIAHAPAVRTADTPKGVATQDELRAILGDIRERNSARTHAAAGAINDVDGNEIASKALADISDDDLHAAIRAVELHQERSDPDAYVPIMPNELVRADDSIGAMRVDGHHSENRIDTPATRPMNDVWVTDKFGNEVPGPRPTDSISARTAGAIDRFEEIISLGPLKSTRSIGQTMRSSPFHTTRAAYADLIPGATITQNVAAGKGTQALLSKNEAFVIRTTRKIESIRDEGMKDTVSSLRKISDEDHLLLIDEWHERNGHLSRDQAYEEVDAWINAAAKYDHRRGETEANRLTFSFFSRAVDAAHRNGDRSVISGVARASKRLREEIELPIVERGNSAAGWGIDVDAARGISETYASRWWKIDEIRENPQLKTAFIRQTAPYFDVVDPSGLGRTQERQANDLIDSMIHGSQEKRFLELPGLKGNPKESVVLDFIPDSAVMNLIDNNIFGRTNALVHRASREVIPAEHFGSEKPVEVFNLRKKELQQEYDDTVTELGERLWRGEIKQAKHDKVLARLKERRKFDMDELDIAYDVARGINVKESDTVAILRNVTMTSFLGRSGFAQAPDFATMKVKDLITKVFPTAAAEIHLGIKRIFNDPTIPESVRRENAKELGAIIDNAQAQQMYHATHSLIGELDAEVGKKTFKEMTAKAANLTHVLSGMKTLADTARVVHADNYSNSAIKILKGLREGTEYERQDLARAGLTLDKNDPMTARIVAQLEKHGSTADNGIEYANTVKWDDDQAAEFFNASGKRFVEFSAVTPDASTARFVERTAIGKLLFQFTSFQNTFIDKAFRPALERGWGEAAPLFMKVVTLTYAGLYLRELAYNHSSKWINGEETDDVDHDKLWTKAILQSITQFGTSTMTAIQKFSDAFLITREEALGLQKRHDGNTPVPALAVLGTAGKIIRNTAEAAFDEGELPDAKEKKLINEAGARAPIINTPLFELPLRALTEAWYNDN